ncbi:MAG: hypothetical protein HYW49_00080 [Deltaproteobacteria bacterium]|nr:hypothetical protein [Deltaproteobacteria bacterium]
MGLPLQTPVEARLETSPLCECIERILAASRELGASITTDEAEKMAFLVANAMSTRNRDFHDLEHALAISSARTAIGKLAGLFHDVVYVQIDRARLPELSALIAPCIPSEELSLKLTATLLRDKDIATLATVFGFKKGVVIGPSSGINEFLSALAAWRALKKHLRARDLLGIVACIEATIPFRTPAGDCLTAELGARLLAAGKAVGEDLPAPFVEKILKAAVEVANQDVSGFAASDQGLFVHQSWALLYETNPELQRRFYTLDGYMVAIHKMDSFFNALNAPNVFRHYKGFPAQENYAVLFDRASSNIAVGKQYTAVKLIEAALLTAIAEQTGGPVPADYFYGARPRSREARHARLEDGLPPIHELRPSALIYPATWRLLIEGRTHRSRFDNKSSYLGAFIISKLNDGREFKNLYAAAKGYASGKSSRATLLAEIPRTVLAPVLDALALVAPGRKDAFARLKPAQTAR